MRALAIAVAAVLIALLLEPMRTHAPVSRKLVEAVAEQNEARPSDVMSRELHAAGDDVARVAFAAGAAGRRAAAVRASRAVGERSVRLARLKSRQATEAAGLLRALAVALRSYDLAQIDVLSARRADLVVRVERELARALRQKLNRGDAVSQARHKQ
jgi:hypothetical protein